MYAPAGWPHAVTLKTFCAPDARARSCYLRLGSILACEASRHAWFSARGSRRRRAAVLGAHQCRRDLVPGRNDIVARDVAVAFAAHAYRIVEARLGSTDGDACKRHGVRGDGAGPTSPALVMAHNQFITGDVFELEGSIRNRRTERPAQKAKDK